MTHEQLLHQAVGAVRARIRRFFALEGLCLGVAAAALGGLLLVAAGRLAGWTTAYDLVVPLLLFGAAAGLALGWSRPVSLRDAALLADERAGLKERLSTAVELAAARAPHGEEEGPLRAVAAAQLADAARHAGALRPAEVLPWRAPRPFRPMLGALVLLLAALYLPGLSLFHTPQERLDRAAMRREGQRMEEAARRLRRELAGRRDSDAEILRRVARNMEQLGKDQRLGRVSKKQALLAMNRLEQQIREAERRIETGEGRVPLEAAAAALRRAAEQAAARGRPETAHTLAELAERLERRDLEGAGRQLEQLAATLSAAKEMAPEAARRAAETLERMAQALEGSSLDQAAREMREASRNLEEAARAGEPLAQRMAQAGSDAERQRLQEEMAQRMEEKLQQASQACRQAGGT